MTTDEIVTTICRMPLGPSQRARLMREAFEGRPLAVAIVHLHTWRQQQIDRPVRSWFDRIWVRLWRP